jgi:hypothetical protein
LHSFEFGCFPQSFAILQALSAAPQSSAAIAVHKPHTSTDTTRTLTKRIIGISSLEFKLIKKRQNTTGRGSNQTIASKFLALFSSHLPNPPAGVRQPQPEALEGALICSGRIDAGRAEHLGRFTRLQIRFQLVTASNFEALVREALR